MILYMFTDIHVIHQSNLRCDSGGGLDSFHHGHYFSFQFLLTQRLVSLLNRKVWCCLLSFLRLTLSLQSTCLPTAAAVVLDELTIEPFGTVRAKRLPSFELL